jgi:photosystem II stability/assembly factor-like uncharacterized protein
MKMTSSTTLRMRLLALAFMLVSLQAFAHFGPRTPLGGYVTCATHYNGIVYFGTESGGVYESTNNQLVGWRPRPVGLIKGEITAITHSGSYLFAGTADGGVFVFNGYVGSDRYWNKASNGLGNLQIKSLVAVDSITVLAGTNGGGLYKTTDKGASWTAINQAQLNNAVVTSLAKGGSRFFAATTTGGVFASDNGGDTWFDFNDVLIGGIGGTSALSYNDTTDMLLVLNSNGLFVTSAAATTMSPSYSAAQTGLASSTVIRALANNGSNWYLATSAGVQSSPGASIAWTAANTGLPHTDVTAIAALPGSLVTAVRKTGIFKSSTASVSWAFTNTGFNNPITRSMAMAGDSLVIAVTDDGVFVSRKLGSPATTFVRSNTGLHDSTLVEDILLTPTRLFAATHGGVYVSQDTGATWTLINAGLGSTHIVRLAYGNRQVYAIDMMGAIYTKEVSATTWTAFNTGLPSGVMPTDLITYGNHIVLGTMGQGVYLRGQHGSTWTAFNTGLGNLMVTSVTAASGRLYAGTEGSGVYISPLDSADWTATAQTVIPHTTMIGLDGSMIQAMHSYAGYVYASYKGGLIATPDQGLTWEEGGNQFNLPSYTDVRKIGFVKTRVFALTEDNGPYANSLSELPTLANFLDLSDEEVIAPQPGRSDFITVTSNVPWTVVSNDPWITVLPATGFRDGTLELVTAANSGLIRTGSVTVSSDSLAQPLVILVTQDGVVGTRDVLAQGTFVLVPNPNTGRFRLDLRALRAEANQADILDLQGRTVASYALSAGSKGLELELPLAPGTYVVRLHTSSGVLHQKLMIQ